MESWVCKDMGYLIIGARSWVNNGGARKPDGVGSLQGDGGFEDMGYMKELGEQRRSYDTRWSWESAMRWGI